jgi:hypothetical protein
MKPLIAVLIFGLFFSSPCFAQTQTGNASYNASKNGLTLAHASMSFGTRVKITNQENKKDLRVFPTFHPAFVFYFALGYLFQHSLNSFPLFSSFILPMIDW